MSVPGDLRDRQLRRCQSATTTSVVAGIPDSTDCAGEVARLASLTGGTASTPAVPPVGVECRTTSPASRINQARTHADISPESCLRKPKSKAFSLKRCFQMTALFRKLLNDEAGLILSAELVIILTITVLGMVVGLVNLQHALLNEFADLSLAFQSLNQSYHTPSFAGCWKWWGGRTSWVAGSTFIDVYDGCVGAGVAGNYMGGDIVGGAGYYGSNVNGGGAAVYQQDSCTATSAGTSTTTTTGVPCDVPGQATQSIPAPGAAPYQSLQGAPIAAPCTNCQ